MKIRKSIFLFQFEGCLDADALVSGGVVELGDDLDLSLDEWSENVGNIVNVDDKSTTWMKKIFETY
jgi:hypothetical protein